MNRKLSLFAACAVALVVCAPGRGQDTPQNTPSLGDIARQAQKDKANKPPAKVITNDDMSSGSGSLASALGVGTAQPGQPGAASKPEVSQSPMDGLGRLQSVVDQLDTLDRATLVSNVLKGNTANFPGRAKWEEKLFAAKQTFVVQCRDVLQKARQLEAAAETMKDVQDPNDPRAKMVGAKLQQLIQESQQASSTFQGVIEEGKDLASLEDSH
jgi:hypothetical protein